MKNKYAIVRARSFDRQTGKPKAKPRNEKISLKKNELFQGCNTVLDIKTAYETFWNELNAHSSEIVFVHKITLL